MSITIRLYEHEDTSARVEGAARDMPQPEGLHGWEHEPGERFEIDGATHILTAVYQSIQTGDVCGNYRHADAVKEPTAKQLRALLSEASSAGDEAQVALCWRAIGGNWEAEAACAQALAEAAAQDDTWVAWRYPTEDEVDAGREQHDMVRLGEGSHDEAYAMLPIVGDGGARIGQLQRGAGGEVENHGS